MNLLKELQKTAKSNALSVSEQQDKLLASVTENLELETRADREMLKHFGVHEKIKKAKSTKTDQTFFLSGIPRTENDIRSVCNRYALKCLPTMYYKNAIPLAALNDMRMFKEKYMVDFDGSATTDKYSYKSSNLFIIAPNSHFHLTTKPAVDPVLLYKLGDFYQIITSWGNDFTWTQRIKGLLRSDKIQIITGFLVPGLVISLTSSGNKQAIFGIGLMGIAFLIAAFFHPSKYNEPYKD